MNRTFEKYHFPCSSPQKIFIPRATGNSTDQFAFQMKLELTEVASKEQQEVKNV